jgi:hypothetical protein
MGVAAVERGTTLFLAKDARMLHYIESGSERQVAPGEWSYNEISDLNVPEVFPMGTAKSHATRIVLRCTDHTYKEMVAAVYGERDGVGLPLIVMHVGEPLGNMGGMGVFKPVLEGSAQHAAMNELCQVK